MPITISPALGEASRISLFRAKSKQSSECNNNGGGGDPCLTIDGRTNISKRSPQQSSRLSIICPSNCNTCSCIDNNCSRLCNKCNNGNYVNCNTCYCSSRLCYRQCNKCYNNNIGSSGGSFGNGIRKWLIVNVFCQILQDMGGEKNMNTGGWI